MSDDEFGFGDDDFDDSFLQQVDDIAAKAVIATVSNQSVSAFQNALRLARDSPITRHTSAPARSVKPTTTLIRTSSHVPIAGPSRPHQAAPPSSDDYDDFQIPAEALNAIDTMTYKPTTSSNAPLRQSTFHRTSSSSTSRTSQPANGPIPSSRLGMSAAPRSSAGFQTHLNFRRDNQSTKGKTWDRTAFAESGRRLMVKTKDKAKGYVPRDWIGEDDDDEEEEEEDYEPLVPGPKPFVDPHKPYDPQKHLLNAESAKTYIYPTNHPKRDYQFEIIQSAFIDNCLVALPTGLGKTFVAGVVMLNFYRWFPTGKIVFLAPTKPLVNQQIEACQMSCGIPSASAAVMTGSSIPAAQRKKLWDAKRVFYCTPQTLDNDLKNGSVDPKDIVLAVFDEAHKASGHYAYTTILAYITAQNPYFRVLALTATPGNDVVKVQAVVDALHISRIEIREAEAPDISKYMNEKRTEKHTVPMGDVIEDFRDRWADLMRPHVKKLVDANILTDRALDIKRLKPFTMTAKRMEMARDRSGRNKWALGPLQQLEKMARAMGNLLEFSLGMFHTILSEIAGGLTASGKKSVSKGAGAAMRNNYEFQKLVRDVDAEMNFIRMGMKRRTKADKHPKMVKTLQLLLEHFSLAEEDEREHGVPNDTRAMVFCSYRECVLEIVDMLNEHSSLIKATKFVGQAQGKKEDDRGFKQKEQKQTIAQFKEGVFNVLVSTSIGEEGLDIGEVDFVVIYDMPKQSIKLRVGRTGRKRDGKVHVLMSENREDTNWDAAQRNHRDIQEEILRSRNLELFDDVERLLPPGKLPICEERFMEVDPWDPEEGKTKKKLAAATRAEKSSAGKKSAEDGKKQRGHEIPENGHAGFKSVAELLRESGRLPPKGQGGRKRKEQRVESESEESEEEEEADLDLIFEEMERKSASKRARADGEDSRGVADGQRSEEAGSPVPPPKKRAIVKKARGRVQSEGLDEGSEGGDAGAPKTRKGKGRATAKSGAAAKPRGKGNSNSPVCDDVDAGEEAASRASNKGKAKAKPRKPKAKKAEEVSVRHPAHPVDAPDDEEETLVDDRMTNLEPALDFLSVAPVPRRRGETPRSITPPSSPSQSRHDTKDRTPSRSKSPMPDLEDSPFHFDLPGTRPVPKPAPDAAHGNVMATDAATHGLPPSLETLRGGAKATRLSPGVAAMAGFSQIAPVDLTWDDDIDLDTHGGPMSSPPPPPSAQMPPEPKSTPVPAPQPVSTPGVPLRSSGILTNSVPGRRRIMGISRSKPSPAPLMSSASRDAMPPPPLPAVHTRSSPIVSPLAATQFPVRRVGKRKVALPSSDDGQTPERSTAQARTGRQVVEASPVQVAGRLRRRRDSPPAEHARKRRSAAGRRAAGRFLDLDAERSGSEGSSDEPGSEHDIETESDRQFAGLNFAPTQAPRGYNQRAAYAAGLSTQMASKSGLHFAANRHDAAGWLAKARRPVLVSDDEGDGGEGSSENEYEMGSFVCDDADLSFDSQDGSDPLDSQR